MAGEFLPPVVTRLEADISDLVIKVAEAKTLLRSLATDMNVALKVDTQGLARATTGIGAAAAATGLWTRALGLTNFGLHALVTGAIDVLAVGLPALVAAAAWAAVWVQGTQNATRHLSALYTATEATRTAFGQTIGDALGLGHALQTAQNAANVQVYEALGAGLNILGGHLSTVGNTGLKVGGIFDTFAAKLTYDFGPNGTATSTMNKLTGSMVQDLTGIGQLFGNLGHALANFAAAMPGVANMVLSTLVAVSRLVLSLSGLGTVITAVFALHEFNFWGTALVNVLGRAGLATEALSGSYFGLGRASGILVNALRAPGLALGTLVSSLGSAMTGFGRFEKSGVSAAGMALRNFGADITDASLRLGPWGAALIAVAGAGLGFLIYKLVSAKTATQQFISSLQGEASSAPNLSVLDVLTNNIGRLEQRLNALPASAQIAWASMVRIPGTVAQAHQAYQDLNAAISQTSQQMVGVTAHATQLGNAFHTSMVGGMVLAQQAGVNLLNTLGPGQWAIAQLQVANYVRGLQAMGQTTGAVGADESYLAIQSGLAASKVGQLNQAFSEFTQNMTAGELGLGQFTNSLDNITTVVAHVGNNLGQSSQIQLSVSQFAHALTGSAGISAQAWINFEQVVGSTVPSLINWMRTAGAEGALSGQQFERGVLDMVAQLVPLARDSKVAQAQVLALAQASGANIKSWPELLKLLDKGHYSAKDLAKVIGDASIKMADMNRVAQQLSTAVQQDFINTFAQAIISSGSMTSHMNALIGAVQRFGANSPQAHGALADIQHMLQLAGIQGNQLKTIMQGLQQYIDGMHGTNLNNTVTTTWYNSYPGTSSSPNPATRRYASGTSSATPGWAWVGENGPELMHLRGGEQIQSSSASRDIAARGGPGGGGDLHITVMLDGEELRRSTARATWQDNIRNGNRMPDGRPNGVMRPR